MESTNIDTVTITLTRDEVSVLEKLLNEEARYLEAPLHSLSPSLHLKINGRRAELGKKLDELHHKIHDQM